jgi:riboflavin kinase / FMN adenylyltransferase
MTMPPISFEARIISGAGRGKKLGAPTMNLNLDDVPGTLAQGIYACFASVDGRREQAALHYGPRPVFKDSVSCEVHLLDWAPMETPDRLTVHVVQYLREVQDFPSPEALMEQIKKDIEETRAILKDA